jgi:hypothetical protein
MGIARQGGVTKATRWESRGSGGLLLIFSGRFVQFVKEKQKSLS